MAAKHILIVDDERRVAFFLSKALEHASHDYRISVAHSGEEALELFDRTSIDLLVTDLRMPGISGLDLIRWVRASSPQTRTILITAYGNGQVETEAHNLGAQHYITKPFSLEDFKKAVRDALQDRPISQPGLITLADETFETISEQLEELRRDVGAQCIFLADMLGQRLAEVGVTSGIDPSTALSLLAGSFATAGEMARHLGSGQAVNFNFHEGSRYEIYSANVGNNLFLAMIYERRVQSSRIGIVWLYTRRMIERLLATISADSGTAPAQHSLDADFGSSLMAELDTLFPATPQAATTRFVQAEHAQPARTKPTPGLAPQGQPFTAETEARNARPHHDQGEEEELFDLETAIARGIIPANLGSGL
jgi:CheY-like chemotaxis protein